MKKIALLMLSAVVLIFSACAYYSKMAVPVNPADQNKYEVVKHVNKSAIGFRLFMLFGTVPSAMDLVHKSISEANGDGMVNLEVTLSEGFVGPFTLPKVSIEGDVVRLSSIEAGKSVWNQSGSAENSASSQKLTNTDQSQPKTATVLSETQIIEMWKNQILEQYKKYSVNEAFARYNRRTGQKLKINNWIETLSNEDYNNFKNAKILLDKWLIQKWDAEIQSKKQIVAPVP